MIRSRVVLNDRTIYPTEQQSAQRNREMPAAMIDALKASSLGTGRPAMVETPIRTLSTPVSPSTNTTWIAQTRSSIGTLLISTSEKYLRFYCESTRKNYYVRSMTCANVTDAFIAKRIVRRLGLQLQRCATATKSLLVGREMIPPTSSFVLIDVSTCVGCGDAQDIYRFYVVEPEDCTFDIVLGPRISHSLRCRSAMDEKGISIG
jgi:hypothetical protein